MIKKISIVIILLIPIGVCLFSQEATPEPSPSPYPTCSVRLLVTGNVIDVDTGVFLSNATITVQGNMGTDTITSGANGSYSIYLPICDPGNSVTFTVTLSGYTDLAFTTEIYQNNEIVDLYMTQYCPVLGDVTGNGIVDIVDALRVAQYYVGISGIDWLCASNVNCDQYINIVDALLIAQFYVGLINNFSCN